MSKISIAFLTKDRVKLARQSIRGLTNVEHSKTANPDIDLWWIDGSDTREGQDLWQEFALNFKTNQIHIRSNIRGGAGAAIVYALTTLLAETNSSYIGLVESDVLCDSDWLEPTLELFEIGNADGLRVGAVSCRSFVDRVLIHRPKHAVMHNLGAGMIVLTREAARLILNTFRTPFTTENRLVFSQLAGVDLAEFWAFRGGEHFLTADWWWDAMLAAHGYASLALVPSKAKMIGQDIATQGLQLCTEPRDHVADPSATFVTYQANLARNEIGQLQPAINEPFYRDAAGQVVFPHEIAKLGGVYFGEWKLREMRGFGTFGWESRDATAALDVPVLGQCELLVGGGKDGGRVRLTDPSTGYVVKPTIKPEGDETAILSLHVPGGVQYRMLTLQMLDPGLSFLGLRCATTQPYDPFVEFTYETLPPP